MKNVSVKSGQKNTIPTIINFKNSNLVVHLLSFSLLKAHGALICKIHKAVLSSAGRAGCVKLIQESPSVYPYTAIPCTVILRLRMTCTAMSSAKAASGVSQKPERLLLKSAGTLDLWPFLLG